MPYMAGTMALCRPGVPALSIIDDHNDNRVKKGLQLVKIVNGFVDSCVFITVTWILQISVSTHGPILFLSLLFYL